jgi:hypothetical protein
VPECETVDFNELEHGDPISSLSLFGGTLMLTVEAARNDPAGPVTPTAYDTELWDDAGNPPPNSTHDDTQRAILCNAASNGGIGECDGIVLMIPDVNFQTNGDDSDGGFVNITGFSGSFEIPHYDAVDSDNTSRDIILRVGSGLAQVGTSTGQGNGTVETVQTDPHTFTGSAQFEYEGSGAVDNIEICRVEEGFCGDGSTPGYWKQAHHFDSWVGFMPSDDFETVFGVDASFTLTLRQALKQGGGGEKALGRHAVAALLSAASGDVDYFDDVAGVIQRVQDAYASGDFKTLKNLLDEQNNLGCPLN